MVATTFCFFFRQDQCFIKLPEVGFLVVGSETFCFFFQQDQCFIKLLQFDFLVAKFHAGIGPVRSKFENIFKRFFGQLGQPHGSIYFAHVIITFSIQLVQFDKFSAFSEGDC